MCCVRVRVRVWEREMVLVLNCYVYSFLFSIPQDMSCLTLDVIGRVAFGVDLSAQSDQGSQELMLSLERYMAEMSNVFAYIPFYHYLPTPVRVFLLKLCHISVEFKLCILQGNLEMKRAVQQLREKALFIMQHGFSRKVIQLRTREMTDRDFLPLIRFAFASRAIRKISYIRCWKQMTKHNHLVFNQ